jgi:hypothetical protein
MLFTIKPYGVCDITLWYLVQLIAGDPVPFATQYTAGVCLHIDNLYHYVLMDNL